MAAKASGGHNLILLILMHEYISGGIKELLGCYLQSAEAYIYQLYWLILRETRRALIRLFHVATGGIAWLLYCISGLTTYRA